MNAIPNQHEATENAYRKMREEGTVASAFRDRNPTEAQRVAWVNAVKTAGGKILGRCCDMPRVSNGYCLSCGYGDQHAQNCAPSRQLAPIELDFLIDMEIEKPAALVGALVREGSLGMIHAPAGCGKTFFSLGIATSLAYGVPFLGYAVSKVGATLYVDGEMAAYDMRERSRLLSAPMKAERGSGDRGRLFVVTPDLHPDGIPKIDSQEGADALFSLIDMMKDEIKLVIIDNLACLTRPDGDDTHGAKSFSFVQDLMLKLRSRSIACWIVHHSGKSGAQRGTSTRADVLDVILRLTPNVSPGEGRTEITVSFEKARHMKPDEKTDFLACLEPSPQGEGLIWSRSLAELPINERIRLMLVDGMPPGDIASELKCNRSFVYRIQKELQEAGDLSPKGKRSGGKSNAGGVVSLSPSLRRGQETNQHSEAGDKSRRQLGDRGDRRHEY